MPEFSLTKAERLSGERAVARLFEEGKGSFVWPFRYLFRTEPTAEDAAGVAVLISVPKRNHKSAVRRNRLKRQTREAYRLHKHTLIDAASEKRLYVDMGLIYSSKERVAYHDIERSIRKILETIARNL